MNRKKVLQSALFFVIVSAVIIFLAEIEARLYYFLTSGASFSCVEQQKKYAERSEKINLTIASYAQGDTESNILHPYFGFVSSPFPSIPLKQEGDFDIIVLGGSVASGLVETQDTIIQYLKQDKRFAEKNIRVFNYSRGGYKQPQQAMIAAYLFTTGASLGLIINMDGYNEVALSRQNQEVGVDISYPSYMHWAHLASPEAKTNPLALEQIYLFNRCRKSELALLRRVIGWRLYKSCAFCWITDFCLKRLQRQAAEYQIRYVRYLMQEKEDTASKTIRGPRHSNNDDAMENAVDIWKKSSLLIHRLCKASGVCYVHILQPTLFDTGSKPLSEIEKTIVAGKGFNDVYRMGVQKGYPLLRAAGKQLRNEGINFFDFSFMFKDTTDSVYTDFSHYSLPFKRVIARKVAEAIIGIYNQ